MQTNAWSLASGIHKLAFEDGDGDQPAPARKERPMSKTASVALAPSSSLLTRLVATIDRMLMASAQISLRNGDVPRFGL